MLNNISDVLLLVNKILADALLPLLCNTVIAVMPKQNVYLNPNFH